MEWVLKHWALLVFAFNGLLAWGLWSMAQKFATKKDIEALRDRLGASVGEVSKGLGAVRSRIDMVEAEMAHLPTAQAMHEQAIRMERLIGAMESANKDYQHVLGRQARLEDAMIRHENILSEAARSRRGGHE